MKKAIPILMSTSLVFAAIAPSVSAATNTEKKLSDAQTSVIEEGISNRLVNIMEESNIDDAGKFKELSTNFVEEGKNEISISSSFEDTETNDKHDFNIEDKEDVRIVEHIIDGKLESKTIYDKKTGIVNTIDKNGNEITMNASDLVKEVSQPTAIEVEDSLNYNNEISLMSKPSGSGWSLAKFMYSPTWGETGHLYTKSTQLATKYYQLNISAGTLLSTVLGVIEIIATKGGLTAILRALGYAVAGSAVDSYVSGGLDATKYQDDIEVWSQDELGLKTYQYTIKAVHKGKTVKVVDGGDTRSYDQMLEAGIYNVVIFNS